jgi:hypothetical protein
MNTLRRPFSGALVDAGDGHGKRGDQHEASCLISIRRFEYRLDCDE